MKQKRFLTSTQAANYLGLSRPTLYKLAEMKEIAHYKILGVIRFIQQDLDNYLKHVRIEATRTPRRRRKS
jgi:excisionase family DNA binding protein